MPSTTDSEFASLVAQFGPGLSLQDMRMKQLGGPTTPGKSTTDLEYAYFASQGGSTSNSRSDNESKYWPGNNSLSDDKFTAGSVVTKVRTNYAINPGYESGANTCFFSNETSIYVPSTDTTSPIAGTKSYLTTRSALTPSIAASNVLFTTNSAGPFDLVPGNTVMTCGVSVKTDTPGMTIYTGMYWYDSVGALTVGNQTARVISTVAGQVIRLVESNVYPVGTTKAYFVVNILTAGNAIVGTKVWYDQLTIEYGTTDGSYFDGDVPDTFTMDYAWTGAANASTSTATQKVMPSGGYTNLCLNPTPGSAIYWQSNDQSKYTHIYANNEISVDRQATAAVGIAASAYALGIFPYNPVLPAGVKYQRSIEIWVDAAATTGVFPSGFSSGTNLPANTWTRVVEQFTGTGVAYYVLGIEVNIPGVGTGVHCKMRKVQLIENPSGHNIPYFDGSTPDEFTMDYAWTGTPNLSTSTATQKVMPSGGYTNLIENCVPAFLSNWATLDNAKWVRSYTSGIVSIERTVTADPLVTANIINIGASQIAPNLSSSLLWQCSVEVYSTVPVTVTQSFLGGFPTGQVVPANVWTTIYSNFAGSDTSLNVFQFKLVAASDPGVGILTQLRHSMLINNQQGHRVPYFDGSTPDTSSIDYAWTGAVNQSTSTAKPIGS